MRSQRVFLVLPNPAVFLKCWDRASRLARGTCGLKRLYAEDQVSDGVSIKIICSGIISEVTWIETIVIYYWKRSLGRVD